MITNFKMNKLLLIQQEIPTIKKDSTANIPTKKGGEFSYNYADINSILDVVKPILNKHGVVLFQPIVVIDGKNAIKTQLIDSEDGKILIESTMLLLSLEDPKENGSVITYYRRYALQSLLSLEAEDDENALPDKPKTFMKEKIVFDESVHQKVSMPSMDKDKFKETARKFEALGGGYDGGFFLPNQLAEEYKLKHNQ